MRKYPRRRSDLCLSSDVYLALEAVVRCNQYTSCGCPISSEFKMVLDLVEKAYLNIKGKEVENI